MKISELKNAPQWLLDAATEDADVEIINGRVVWLDGKWYSGEWRDGIWLGGTWYSGKWYSGKWSGGEWLGGEWYSGKWLYEPAVIPPMSLFGLRWPVHVSDTRMQIGCQKHTHEQWENFTDTEISSMHKEALPFWTTHRTALLALCEARRIAVALSGKVIYELKIQPKGEKTRKHKCPPHSYQNWNG
jgi:hypothetical protein